MIPIPLKNAISVGIGIFIAFIGLQNAKIVIASDATLVTMQNFAPETFSTHGISAVLGFVGVLIASYFIYKKITGGILWSILITWILGMICQLTHVYQVNPELGAYNLIPQLTFDSFREPLTGFCELFGSAFSVSEWGKVGDTRTGFDLLLSSNFVVVVCSFLFVDLFSAIGTLTGVATQANLLDSDGKLSRIKGAFMADSIATTAGAILGTSTTSSYVESAAGVAEGGRTGLSAFCTAILFLLAIVFAPLLLSIPPFATAPALIIVGFYMMQPIVQIDFNDHTEAIPTYLTIIVMPLSYSITDGISAGVISWTILHILAAKRNKVSVFLIILSLLFIAKYIFL